MTKIATDHLDADEKPNDTTGDWEHDTKYLAWPMLIWKQFRNKNWDRPHEDWKYAIPCSQSSHPNEQWPNRDHLFTECSVYWVLKDCSIVAARLPHNCVAKTINRHVTGFAIGMTE